MKKYFDTLRKCSLFSGISDDDMMPLLGCLDAKVVYFDKKYTILAEGDRAKYIGIVLSGSAQIIQVDYFGNRSIISSVATSDMFGEAFACAEVEEIPISVVASEACEIMLIDCGRVMHSCSKSCGFHQQMIYNLMKNLAVKNIRFHQKIEITSKRTTREKLMAYLLLRAKECGKSRFDIPFDRQELADYLEVDRSGLSAEISKLRREKVIECKKNHFEILHS